MLAWTRIISHTHVRPQTLHILANREVHAISLASFQWQTANMGCQSKNTLQYAWFDSHNLVVSEDKDWLGQHNHLDLAAQSYADNQAVKMQTRKLVAWLHADATQLFPWSPVCSLVVSSLHPTCPSCVTPLSHRQKGDLLPDPDPTHKRWLDNQLPLSSGINWPSSPDACLPKTSH